jgi:hypothetical protein
MGNKSKDIRSEERLTRLKLENQKLRRQLQKLRKQLQRVDLEEYQNVRDLLESQDREDAVVEEKINRENLINKWLCHQCQEDYLRLIVLNRPDGAVYFRKCATCGHRTKLQKYTENVEGVVDGNIRKN